VRWQVIPVNPARAVEPPKPERKEARFLDESRTVWLLEALRGTRLYFPTVLAVATGMRRGEVLGLRWEDIDSQFRAIRVVRSLEETRAGIKVKETKTHRGRPIKLPETVFQALEEHRQIQEADRMMFGPAYKDSGFICCREDGSLWEPDWFTSEFSRAAKKLGLNASFHSLRHSHASHLLRKGINPKVVSERLGHSTVTLTMNTYAHVLPGMQEEAAAVTDEILEKALKPVMPANRC
jgi:integrase